MEHPISFAILLVIGLGALFEAYLELANCGGFALVLIIGGLLTLGAAGWLADDNELAAEIESGLAVVVPLAFVYFDHVPLGCAI